jgi:hypothetical protein
MKFLKRLRPHRQPLAISHWDIPCEGDRTFSTERQERSYRAVLGGQHPALAYRILKLKRLSGCGAECPVYFYLQSALKKLPARVIHGLP